MQVLANNTCILRPGFRAVRCSVGGHAGAASLRGSSLALRCACSTQDASSMSSADEAIGGTTEKLRMLCLHGFLQNSEVLRMRIGSMRKALKSRVDFLFCDAPFQAASTLTEQQIREVGGRGDGLTWFQWQDLGPDKRPSLAVKYARWEDTYASLCDSLRRETPDGIFGFSQGATAAALFLAALTDAQRNGRDLDVPLPRFVIIVAGFLPRDPEYSTLLQTVKCTVPALFVVGESDELIPPDRSAALMATWHAPAAELLKHGGAHMVPTCSGPVKQQIVSFLDRYRADEGSVHSTTVSKQECASASAT